MNDIAQKYTVKTENFEGPLEVLLEMIEKRKMFVNELSLASVTDDYVNYIRSLPALHIGDTANFIVVAATLILIKSRSLLPNLELSDDEKVEISDLENRLRMYQVVKEVAQTIKSEFGKQVILMSPDRNWTDPVFSPDASITISRLRSAMDDVFDNLPKKEIIPEVTVRKVVSIEEMIDSLGERISKGITTSFKDFSKSNATDKKEAKVYVIVSFLAMLELVRNGLLDCIQNEEFGDIEMYGVN